MRRLIFTALLAALLPLTASAQWYIFPGSGHRKDTAAVVDSKASEVEVAARQAPLQIALSLPFRSKATPSSNFLDFYGGFLLAVKEKAAATEHGINLKVFDTADPANRADAITLRDCDLTVGPVGVEELMGAFSICPDKPIVSPLEPKGTMLTGSYPVIQVPSSWEDQVRTAVEWLASEMTESDNVVLLQDFGSEASEMTARAVGYLNESGIVYTIATDPDRLESLCTGGCTRFVLITDNSTYIGDCVRNIALLGVKGANVALYGSSKIRTCGEAEKGSLCSAGARICASYYIDSSREDVKKFRDAYVKEYSSEPGEFAFQGYDIATYFIGVVAGKGNGWMDTLPETPYNGLLSGYRFQATGKGAVNTAVRKLRYCFDGQIRTND